MGKIEICKYCGQELDKDSNERKEIQETQLKNIIDVSDALTERQNKLDAASHEMLDIIQRIEVKVGADMQTLQEVKELEARIRAKILVEDKRQDLFKNSK